MWFFSTQLFVNMPLINLKLILISSVSLKLFFFNFEFLFSNNLGTISKSPAWMCTVNVHPLDRTLRIEYRVTHVSKACEFSHGLQIGNQMLHIHIITKQFGNVCTDMFIKLTTLGKPATSRFTRIGCPYLL